MDATEQLEHERNDDNDDIESLSHRVLEPVLRDFVGEHSVVKLVAGVVDIEPWEHFDEGQSDEEVVCKPAPFECGNARDRECDVEWGQKVAGHGLQGIHKRLVIVPVT